MDIYMNGLDLNIVEKYKKELDYLKSIFNMMINKWDGLRPKSVKKVWIMVELNDGMRLHKDISYMKDNAQNS